MKNGPYELIIAPEDYPGKKYRQRYAYEHHVVYWQHTGHVLQEGENIHHKNENKRDNRFINLELIKHIDHIEKHLSQRMITYAKLECPICKKIFIKEKRQTHLTKKKQKATFCSKQCADKKHTEVYSLENNVILIFKG